MAEKSSIVNDDTFAGGIGVAFHSICCKMLPPLHHLVESSFAIREIEQNMYI